LVGRLHSREAQFDRDRLRDCFDFLNCLGVKRVVGIPKDSDPGELWIYFL
jgi:hypothetical protein